MRVTVLVILVIVLCIALSLLADVPYLYTVTGVAVWAAAGHLVTLEDDAPGGWSNSEKSSETWKQSKAELLLKFAILFVLISIIFFFPDLARLGG